MKKKKYQFNKRFSRARTLSENAFGVLCARFRVFHTTIGANPTNADNIIKAAVVLHNMLTSSSKYASRTYVDHYVNGKLVQGQWRSEVPANGTGLGLQPLKDAQRLGKRSVNDGHTIRDYLADYVQRNPLPFDIL